MSELYVVRHGQASFAAQSYDALSDTGRRQVEVLRDYWQRRGLRFDAAYSGDLTRQLDTCHGLRDAAGGTVPVTDTRFNEFPAEAVVGAYRQQFGEADGFSGTEAEIRARMQDRRYFQRFLEAASSRWMRDELNGGSFETWPAFKARVNDALSGVMSSHAGGQRVLIATSGGVIALAVQRVLQMPDAQTVNLAWMIYNCSVTRIRYGGGRVSLESFNSIAHLETAGRDEMITHR